jgi:hypothetical protein
MAGASPKFLPPHAVRRFAALVPGGAATDMQSGDDFGATAHVNHDSGYFRGSLITFAAYTNAHYQRALV